MSEAINTIPNVVPYNPGSHEALGRILVEATPQPSPNHRRTHPGRYQEYGPFGAWVDLRYREDMLQNYYFRLYDKFKDKEIAAKFKDYFDYDFARNNDLPNTPEQAVEDGFDWGETLQGFDYWNNLSKSGVQMG